MLLSKKGMVVKLRKADGHLQGMRRSRFTRGSIYEFCCCKPDRLTTLRRAKELYDAVNEALNFSYLPVQEAPHVPRCPDRNFPRVVVIINSPVEFEPKKEEKIFKNSIKVFCYKC